MVDSENVMPTLAATKAKEDMGMHMIHDVAKARQMMWHLMVMQAINQLIVEVAAKICNQNHRFIVALFCLRLVRVYLEKAPQKVVAAGQLNPTLGVFQVRELSNDADSACRPHFQPLHTSCGRACPSVMVWPGVACDNVTRFFDEGDREPFFLSNQSYPTSSQIFCCCSRARECYFYQLEAAPWPPGAATTA